MSEANLTEQREVSAQKNNHRVDRHDTTADLFGVGQTAKLKYKCLHPTRVLLDSGSVYVPCGKCYACRSLARLNRIGSIKDFGSRFKHIYFTLLTYAPAFVPNFKVIPLEDEQPIIEGNNLMHHCFVQRLPRQASVCTDDNLNDRECELESFETWLSLEHFKQASSLQPDRLADDCIMLPSVRDIQLFMKRLRKIIFTDVKKHNYPDGLPSEFGKAPSVIERFFFRSDSPYSLSYYCVSEYGGSKPKSGQSNDKVRHGTYRPHYHIIFFTNSDFVASRLTDYVLRAWKYGGSNTQLSQGNCAEYVASYINTLELLPPLFNQRGFRPFCLHSRGFTTNLGIVPQGIHDFTRIKSLCLNGITVREDEKITTRYASFAHLLRLFPRPLDVYRQRPSDFQKVFSSVFDVVKYHQDGSGEDSIGIPQNHAFFSDFYSLSDLSTYIVFKIVSQSCLSPDEEFFSHYFDLLPLRAMYKQSRLPLDFFNSGSVKCAIHRVYSFFLLCRTTCRLWKIKTKSDFFVHISNCFDFWSSYQKTRLAAFYQRLEQIDSAPFTALSYHLFNPLIIFNDVDDASEEFLLKFANSFQSNSYIDLARSKAYKHFILQY